MNILPEVMIAVTLITIAPVLALVIGRRVFQPGPLSPVWITVSVIAVVGTLGFLLSNFLIGAQGGSIIIQLTPEQRVNTALLYAATAWLILAGAFGSVFLTGRSTVRAKLQSITLNHGAQTLALVIAVLPLLMMAVALGETLLYRTSYLAGERGGQLLGLGQQLATAAAAIVGYVAIAGSKGQRILAALIGIAILVSFFGLGSRRMALLPILFAVGAILANPHRWVRYLIPAAILAAILLPLPLYLRGSLTHGVVPYLAQLASFDISLVDWRSTINNILISFPITGATVFQTSPIPIEYFWISLNPLPGELAGFYDITQNLGLNRYTPYSTIGEVWNRGPAVGIFFWLAVGILLQALDRSVGRWMNTRYSFVGLLSVVLVGLFALTCLQYNLRASGRMLVYAAVIAVAAAVFLGPRVRRDAENRRRSVMEAAAVRGVSPG